MNRGEMEKVEECYMRLWALLPEPKYDWSDSSSMITGLALFFLKTNQHQKALAWIPNLIPLNSSGFFPFYDILIGRIYLESGQQAEATRWFQKIFDHAGKDAFREDNRRFLEFVQPKKPKKAAEKKAAVKPKTDEWPEIPDPEAFKLMAGPVSLDDDVHSQIKALCAKGDELAEADDYDGAITKYREALCLVPRPIEKWDASTWIYTAIGDALFLKGDFLAAAKPLRDVMFCPGAEQNGFIRLRRGQVAFEKGNLPVAEKELIQAYQLEGEEIFSEDDAKYLDFVTAKLKV